MSAADLQSVPMPKPWLRYAAVGLITVGLLWAAFSLYLAGQALFGAILLCLAVFFAFIFSSDKFYGSRFIFPGVAAVLIFIAFPVVYTIWIGFTNFSSFNLLTYERVVEVLTSRSTVDQSTQQPFAVAQDGDSYRIWLPGSGLLSAPVSLAAEETAKLSPAEEPSTLLERRDAIKLRAGLGQLTLETPDGALIKNAGLRNFASVVPEYVQTGPNELTRKDGTVLIANHETGFFETPEGEQVPPGWRVTIGFENFERIFTSEGIRGPTLSIFAWTFAFAGMSVFCCFAVGLLLAVILQWEHLRFKPLYRVLLILPYAVPSFISILVFKGLFNQNFGEINLILEALFGLRPNWFTDATLARTMVVIVNVWLGYPYMMLLAMGFLQSVPEDHKKAAALEGASALRVFFTITLPQIIPPFLPLLIAAFAFNFNNLVLIFLLTKGLPDIPGTVIPAGQTDILASFTYRLAFDNAGQQFGLAGAITLIIFLVVAAISYANFVAMRRVAARRSGAST